MEEFVEGEENGLTFQFFNPEHYSRSKNCKELNQMWVAWHNFNSMTDEEVNKHFMSFEH